MYDVIIIGAGPAGLTAAIYLLRAGKKVLIIEKSGIGGQIASSPLVENYPGFSSISGSDLANNLYEQVDNLGGEFAIDEVTKIDKNKTVHTLYDEFQAKSIILATGCKPRTLGLSSEEELIGNGIHFCVSCDGAFYKNKTVAVIGGGNSALANALYLSDICQKVYVIQNLDHLTGEPKNIDLLEKKNNVEIILNSEVSEYISKNNTLTKIELRNHRQIELDGLFLSIGFIPASDFVKDFVKLNDYGYIDSNDCQTTEEGIFVAGDIRSKEIRQLTTATSDGTIAAIKCIDYLKKIN